LISPILGRESKKMLIIHREGVVREKVDEIELCAYLKSSIGIVTLSESLLLVLFQLSYVDWISFQEITSLHSTTILTAWKVSEI
jgi:hypothetical protein